MLSRNLRYLRKKKGLTQKNLVTLTGISLPILRSMERGRVIPTLTEARLKDLAMIFSVSVEDLLHKDLQALRVL
ncbi:MAG: helix-turn-helix transcriptional regulator [Ruminococcaceae bacterium]|nr:helix-turn-helix transcriptional regulator [Oscillospiraceae bacterium]